MGMEVGETEIREMLRFIFEWIEDQLKRSEIEKWDEKLKYILFESIVEPPCWFVKATAVGNKTFERIHELVKKSFEQRKIPKKLKEIYEKRKAETLRYIDQLIARNEIRAFGPRKAQQIRVLRQKLPKTREILLKIERDARQAVQKHPDRREALQNLNYLLVGKTWIERRPFPFSEMDFTRKVDGKPPILQISYKIWKPHYLYPLYPCEDEYRNFPLKWLGVKLTVWNYQYLYQKWKKGSDLTPMLESFYDEEDAFKSIMSKCRSNHIGFRRVQLLEEIVGNYRDKRYASVVTLALTQIEGVIWDLAITLHNIGVEKIFDREKVKFENCQDCKLINEEGALLEAKPTVGLLIRHTRIKKYLYAPFLDYCTEELFRERNPILHGRITNFGTKLEANKKLLALEMVISTLHSVLVDNADVFLRHVLKEDFEEFQRKLHSGDHKGAFAMLKKVIKTVEAQHTRK